MNINSCEIAIYPDGFIQFLAYWVKQDIELFYELGSAHSLVTAATSNIAVKLCEKKNNFLFCICYL